MQKITSIFVAVGLLTSTPWADEKPAVDKHVMVYYEQGRFGGWPANHGIWSWGNEILFGFNKGYYKDRGPGLHAIDNDKPQRDMLARSLDGGETWTIEDPIAKGYLDFQTPATDCPGGINFTHPDFAMRVRLMDIHTGPSRFHYSYDRGKSWEGPFNLPQLDTPGIAARTDYLVNTKDDCMLFLTAAKTNNKEGRSFVARTTDGGATWKRLSWIGPEPKGFAIMPATVRLSDSELFTIVRRREGPKRWASAYRSTDNASSWTYVNDPVQDLGVGNPAALIKLGDGRLCLTYGVRAQPFRIAAKLSSDNGNTWTDEIVLRDDGMTQDLGYTRSVQRPDGKIVTAYYFTDKKTGVERYIAATIWAPGR